MTTFLRSVFGCNLVAQGKLRGGQLWQGGRPTVAWKGAPGAERFDVLILCAREIQPDIVSPGLIVIHAPMADDYGHFHPDDVREAERAVALASYHLNAGRRVLSTCHHGRNRSGLVSALTLMRVFGSTPQDAIRMVQAARKNALENPQFVRYILAKR